MRVLRYPGLESGGRAAVATVGNFDGVHRAHRALLEAVCADARARGARAVAVSFEPHPNRILHPDAPLPLITPLPEKIRLFAAAGLEELVLLPFTRDLSLLSPREFVERILLRGLGLVSIHEGPNFRFGHRHAGDTAELDRLGRELGFAVAIQPPLRVRSELVSSSRIRALVAAGRLDRARWLLGRPFAVRGRIARGRGIGRQRTVPTLNLEHYEELLPAAGVYFTRATLGEAVHASLTNVGVRPTFGPGALTVETYILDPPPQGFDPQIGEEMEIAFLRWLRPEVRFDSAEALREAIGADVRQAARFFARLRARRS